MCVCVVFFFNDTATTEIYTLSLHDALPIFYLVREQVLDAVAVDGVGVTPADLHELVVPFRVRDRGDLRRQRPRDLGDRKSTRLNSSHANISYAVFCLKKKKIIIQNDNIYP